MKPPEAAVDTNVVLSSLRSQRGCSFRLVDDFMSGRTSWHWNVSNACILEYEEILLREGIPSPVAERFLDDLLARATRIRISNSFRPLSLDPDDDCLAELAIIASGDYLVTFNARDFSVLRDFGIAVVTPQEFCKVL